MEALPRLVGEFCHQWGLEIDGAVMHGYTGLAIPVRRGTEECILKVYWRDADTDGAALALKIWDGRGAVKLLAHEPSQGAVLLERLDPQRSLDTVDIGEAVGIAGRLLRRLAVPAPAQMSSVAARAKRTAQRLPERWERFGRPFPRPLLERVCDWTGQALAPAFEIAPLRRYQRAMKLLADDALSEQDPHCGSWLYELPHGHCFCTVRKHVGEAGFIGCVRMNGLCLYYRLTGDSRVPAALKRYIDFLLNDTWDERLADWRYTSCPASPPVRQIGVTIAAMVHSARIVGDPEHVRVLRKAWQAKFERLQRQAADAAAPPSGMGKDYSLTMYGSAEAAALLAEAERG